jgi:serine/threonine-protein kinase RsbW
MHANPRREFVSDDLVIRLDVTIPGDPAHISPFVDEVMRTVAEAGCAGGAEEHIELSLREALANAIRHGSKGDPTKAVHCTVACDPERGMLIVVRDSGEGFDPNNVPDPLIGENIYSHHGRGIFLISQLMDEVRFERNGTEIHMRKRLRPTESS